MPPLGQRGHRIRSPWTPHPCIRLPPVGSTTLRTKAELEDMFSKPLDVMKRILGTTIPYREADTPPTRLLALDKLSDNLPTVLPPETLLQETLWQEQEGRPISFPLHQHLDNVGPKG